MLGYTPISDPESKGYFDLLVKIYPEGKMSRHLANLRPGDVLEVKGPKVKLQYTPNMKKNIGMIAGGTGITPMLQVIDAVLKNPDDLTRISLLYANISPEDILLKQKLDIVSANYPNLKIYYTVENPANNWKGGKGYITQNMVEKGMPSPSEDTLILVCGPPGMMDHISGDNKGLFPRRGLWHTQGTWLHRRDGSQVLMDIYLFPVRGGIPSHFYYHTISHVGLHFCELKPNHNGFEANTLRICYYYIALLSYRK